MGVKTRGRGHSRLGEQRRGGGAARSLGFCKTYHFAPLLGTPLAPNAPRAELLQSPDFPVRSRASSNLTSNGGGFLSFHCSWENLHLLSFPPSKASFFDISGWHWSLPESQKIYQGSYVSWWGSSGFLGQTLGNHECERTLVTKIALNIVPGYLLIIEKADDREINNCCICSEDTCLSLNRLVFSLTH